MRSPIWEKSTLLTLSNVEKGLEAAHGGLDMLQDMVDQAREKMDAGDHESVEAYVRRLQNALCLSLPLTLARESDLPWEV
ncbi:hypothetical protein ISS40_07890 [Candidatus Bathyarchaeota archaeon]|nr:hypothetical protein [Candidatus Bathyarchaeota archaeon]